MLFRTTQCVKAYSNKLHEEFITSKIVSNTAAPSLPSGVRRVVITTISQRNIVGPTIFRRLQVNARLRFDSCYELLQTLKLQTTANDISSANRNFVGLAYANPTKHYGNTSFDLALSLGEGATKKQTRLSVGL